jgi:hypothetical protein
MGFLCFSNKKKTPAKRFEPEAFSIRPGPPAPAREMRQNFPFFSRKFINVRAFPLTSPCESSTVCFKKFLVKYVMKNKSSKNVW